MRNLNTATRPVITLVLITLNALAFLPSLTSSGALGQGANPLAPDFALIGPAVADGQWWRLITSGFLHYGFMHLGFNLFALWLVGNILEPALGRLRFAIVYFAGLLAGSAGALLLSYNASTAGASGAVFGIMGALFVGQRRLGVDPWRNGIGGLLVINLVFTFAIPNISIGGHLGGLLGGSLAGYLAFLTLRR
ncbi:MAG: rhomboid family intramembrane serine protease [Acidimicrobiales bacterium]